MEVASDRLRSKNENLTKAVLQMRLAERKIRTQANKLENRNEELTTLKGQLEIENKKVKDSIRYAKAIQDAFLVGDSDDLPIVKDFFILYKPKDIVGGDFYIKKRVGNVGILAVADCIGHGAPGALMTVLSYQLSKIF